MDAEMSPFFDWLESLPVFWVAAWALSAAALVLAAAWVMVRGRKRA